LRREHLIALQIDFGVLEFGPLQFEVRLCDLDLRLGLRKGSGHIVAFQSGDDLTFLYHRAFEYAEPFNAPLSLRCHRRLALRHHIAGGIQQRVTLRRIDRCDSRRLDALRSLEFQNHADHDKYE
jgi:hypothetical protein